MRLKLLFLFLRTATATLYVAPASVRIFQNRFQNIGETLTLLTMMLSSTKKQRNTSSVINISNALAAVLAAALLLPVTLPGASVAGNDGKDSDVRVSDLLAGGMVSKRQSSSIRNDSILRGNMNDDGHNKRSSKRNERKSISDDTTVYHQRITMDGDDPVSRELQLSCDKQCAGLISTTEGVAGVSICVLGGSPGYDMDKLGDYEYSFGGGCSLHSCCFFSSLMECCEPVDETECSTCSLDKFVYLGSAKESGLCSSSGGIDYSKFNRWRGETSGENGCIYGVCCANVATDCCLNSNVPAPGPVTDDSLSKTNVLAPTPLRNDSLSSPSSSTEMCAVSELTLLLTAAASVGLFVPFQFW